MKKKVNTHQNPEPENISVQEENSSSVDVTQIINEQQLPTDPDQTEEQTIIVELDHTPKIEPVPEQEIFTDKVPEIETSEQEGELPDTETPIQEINLSEQVEDIETSGPEVELPHHVSDVETSVREINLSEQVADIEPSEHEAELPEKIPDSATPEVKEQLPVEDIDHQMQEPKDILTEEVIDHEEHGHEEELHDEILDHETQQHELNYDECSREELIGLLEKAVAETDINSVKTKIALIKVAFIKKRKEENLRKYERIMEEGGSKEDLSTEPDELDLKFEEIFNIYKANKARFTEQQEKIKTENLKKKQQILDELKQLINSEETLKKTYDEFKTLQDSWKEIGMVPRNEISDLWQNYHFLVEKFFEKVKLNKDLKDLDMRKNLEAKISLCEKTEELLLETSALRSFRKLQKYHEEWKELGPVPADKKDEIWERFKNTTDKINERRREHYARIEDEQQKNLETKIALSEQGEEIIGLSNETIRDWQNNTNKVNELLKIWKSVGSVPQKQNNEIWARFKTSLDAFFTNKKEYFDKLKEQQIQNYNLKVELCLQAEALKTSTDWRKTTNDMIRLQNEWKQIGPVPKKNSDKVWKRFRAACDEFFNTKSSYFSNIQANEEENLNKKLDLLKRLKEYQFGSNKNENLNLLKNFQREWTEIGHIPFKDKDKLQNEFRAIINERLDQLKISEVEITTLTYQSRVESLKTDPQAKRLISREREGLVGKINQMKEDINLWENNIGFLANSKNAAILKDEFEKKINKTKSEVKVLEAKLKMLKMQ
jgi:Domain of Unknown Function (DUF349)